jgi:hypothetical protein
VDPRFSSQSPSVLILFVVAWLDVVLSILCLAVGATESSHTPLCHNARPLSAETCFYSERRSRRRGGATRRRFLRVCPQTTASPVAGATTERLPHGPERRSCRVNERMNDNHVFFANVTPNSLNCP